MNSSVNCFLNIEDGGCLNGWKISLLILAAFYVEGKGSYPFSCTVDSELLILFSSVAQSCPTLATAWTAACQASLSLTSSWSLPKLMSIKLVKPSNHLIFCHPLLLLPSIFPNIRVFSNESVLRIRWPKYWSFSHSNNPSSDYSG